jgi:hypothetical protein
MEKLIFILIVLLNQILTQSVLPQLSFLQSGFDGFDMSKKTSAFRIFDLSDNKNSIMMNGKNFSISEHVQMTTIDERRENSTVGVYATYDSFLHSYTSDFNIKLGILVDNFTLGFGYDNYTKRIFSEMTESKKVAGFSQDVIAIYSLTLAPAFLLP